MLRFFYIALLVGVAVGRTLPTNRHLKLNLEHSKKDGTHSRHVREATGPETTDIQIETPPVNNQDQKPENPASESAPESSPENPPSESAPENPPPISTPENPPPESAPENPPSASAPENPPPASAPENPLPESAPESAPDTQSPEPAPNKEESLPETPEALPVAKDHEELEESSHPKKPQNTDEKTFGYYPGYYYPPRYPMLPYHPYYIRRPYYPYYRPPFYG